MCLLATPLRCHTLTPPYSLNPPSHACLSLLQDYLLFKIDGEAINMMDGGYASRAGNDALAYLTVSRSFPAFLAKIVLDGFDKATLGTTLGS